jgi:5-methyltetrahydrofolate--homocysteine methyltransferase
MDAIFLYYAIKAGMDMGIVNAGQLSVYKSIDPVLRDACEDVVLNRTPETTERMLALAADFKGGARETREKDNSRREKPVSDCIAHALINGITEFIESDVEEARQEMARPLDVIEGR